MPRRKPVDTDDDDDQNTDDGNARAALERVLDHAEANGEVYDGAAEDHATLRQLLADLAGDDS